MDGRMDEQMNGRMDGRMDGQMDEWIDGRYWCRCFGAPLLGTWGTWVTFLKSGSPEAGHRVTDMDVIFFACLERVNMVKISILLHRITLLNRN